MSELVTVVLATRNPGKVLELRALFAGLPVQIVSVEDVLRDAPAIPEDGETFEENATHKAREVSRLTRMIAIADDSGLEVDALAGRPGVRSARFAHERATDAENNAALLRELEDVDEDARGARFRCVLALASPWSDDVRTVEGRLDGHIARTPRGSGGFGYDPLFVVSSMSGRAVAELSEGEKNEISHRGRAALALKPLLLELIDGQLDEVERIAG